MSKIGGGLKKAGQWIGKQAQTAWKDVKNAAVSVAKGVGTTVNKVIDGIKDLANKGMDGWNNMIMIIGLAVAGVVVFSVMNPGKAENIVVTGMKKIPSAL